jgi:hypothetical protein
LELLALGRPPRRPRRAQRLSLHHAAAAVSETRVRTLARAFFAATSSISRTQKASSPSINLHIVMLPVMLPDIVGKAAKKKKEKTIIQS